MNAKKWTKLVLITTLSAGLIAGCSSGEEAATPTPGTSPATTPGQTTPEETPSGLASEEPIELSVHLHFGNLENQIFNDDWAVFQKAAELTNVSLTGSAPRTSTESREVFTLMLANRPLPDIIHFGGKGDMNALGGEGGLIPLQELIEEHAPNIQRYLDEDIDYRRHVTAGDGNIYYLTFKTDGLASTGWFIRQDWLDNLSLEIPATVDDLYEVYTAFRNDDPNDNGLTDEIPYFNRQRHGINYLLNLWDATNSFILDETDTITYGPLHDSYREAMANIAQWYDEQLIDQEFYTREGDVRLTLLQGDIGGSTQDWFASTSGYNARSRDQVPGIEFVPIAPPASISGDQSWFDSRQPFTANGWGISAANAYPVETIKYFDFWFSEEGRRLANFGIEGETYDLVDGTPVLKDFVLQAEGGVLNELKKYGAQIEFGWHQDFENERQWTSPDVLPAIEAYNDIYINTSKQVPDLPFTAQESDRLTLLQGQVNTHLNEISQRWILGGEDVNANFDGFVQNLRSLGIEEILEIRNAAYDRYKEN